LNKKIKILIEGHLFDDSFQGSLSFISNLYYQLQFDNRFELFIISNNKNDVLSKSNLSNFNHIKYRYNNKLLRLMIEIPYVIHKLNIDYAHFQYVTPIYKNCKFIVTIHDLLFLEFKNYFSLKYRYSRFIPFYVSAKRSDFVTTVSNYSILSLKKYFNLKNVILIPNIIVYNLELLQYDKLNNKKYILYVSRIEPRKNHTLLLKTWRKLELYKEDIHLVFIGKIFENTADLDTQLDNLNNLESNYFHFLKDVNIPQMNWFYKNCTLFVYPSLCEGFGIPPLEAAINGSKVLCSNTTAMSEYSFFPSFDPFNEVSFEMLLLKSLNTDYDRDFAITIINERYSLNTVTNLFVTKIVKS
jgi:glycosyltransferase involved in cell wall biosynthesis